MFHLVNILMNRAIGYLESCQKTSETNQVKRRVLSDVELRLARLRMNGKLNGLTDYELSMLILPKLKKEQALYKRFDGARRWTVNSKLLAVVFAVLLLLSALFVICTPCQRLSKMFGRKLLFQLEPYWDWQNVYYSRCLLPSDYLWPAGKPVQQQSMSFNPGSCDYCEDVTRVIRLELESFKHDQKSSLERQFVFNIANKIPFVYGDKTLTNEIAAWPLHRFVSTQHWAEFFSDQQDQENVGVPHRICMFKSSLVSVSHPSQLFIELHSFRPDVWFAHWENCGMRTMKKLRTLFRRPAILPAMIELSKPSWILLSGWIEPAGGSEQGKSYKQINPLQGTDLLIVIQVHGQVQLKLTPTRSDCHDRRICSSLDSIQLTAGQMGRRQLTSNWLYLAAVVSANYWTLSYRSTTAGSATANSSANGGANHHGDSSSNYTDGFNLSLVLAGIHV